MEIFAMRPLVLERSTDSRLASFRQNTDSGSRPNFAESERGWEEIYNFSGSSRRAKNP